MNLSSEPWITRHTNYYADPDASTEALLNDATEWLQFAHNAIQLLAELLHERGHPDERKLPIMLDGIAALIEMGTRCVVLAHGRVQVEQVRRCAGES